MFNTDTCPSFSDFSLRDQVAQLIMIDLPGTELTKESQKHLAQYAWNGVILFAKNVASREQLVAYINDIHANAKKPVFLAIDQEGGAVDRARFADMSLSPGLMALGAINDLEATYQAHRIMGSELKDLGIHLDFAPCIDINNNPANPVIGVRSFGESPELVAQHGAMAIRGLRDGGVAPTAKHFPGHGNTSLDSHIALPTISRTRDEITAVELKPFVSAIEQDVEAIMTAHITFPALDPEPGIPATLSKPILTGLLREKMGYEGVIVTDSLAMRALADKWGFAEATVMSVEAGADLILALGSPERQLEAFNGLLQAVESGRISRERITESLKRLELLRQRYHGRPTAQPTWDVAAHRQEMAAITQRTVTVVRNDNGLLPLQPTAEERILVIAPDLLPQSPLGEVALRSSLAPLIAQYHPLVEERCFNIATSGPAIPDLAQAAADADYVLLALYARGPLSDAQEEIARLVLEANARTVVILLSSPYIVEKLPKVHTCLTGFNYGDLSLQALAKAIMGQAPITGKLPIKLRTKQ